MTRNSLKLLLCGLLLAFAWPAAAGDSLYPEPPEANARFSEEQGCVEETVEMRKNHMEYILHQRDETMYKGIRTKQHSLAECINCHVSESPDAARYGDDEHFCSTCHNYASVKIDCFQCHADRPQQTSHFHSINSDMLSHHPVEPETAPLTAEDLKVFANRGISND